MAGKQHLVSYPTAGPNDATGAVMVYLASKSDVHYDDWLQMGAPAEVRINGDLGLYRYERIVNGQIQALIRCVQWADDYALKPPLQQVDEQGWVLICDFETLAEAEEWLANYPDSDSVPIHCEANPLRTTPVEHALVETANGFAKIRHAMRKMRV